MWILITNTLNTAIYQPVYNFFFIIYNLFPDATNAGNVTIAITLALRFLLLPLSLSEGFSYEQRMEIETAALEIEKKYADNPTKQQTLLKRIIQENRASILLSFISIVIQSI
ncbi:MAG TPA: hypothetical protein ENN77_02715, partial [Candidatus Wirthbacteria bacterium]|nr:hypothetical protein [Candidatus Wirthbacteria bacterium]